MSDMPRLVVRPLRVHAGDRALERLEDELQRAGASRPVIVTGSTLGRGPGTIAEVRAGLASAEVAVFDRVRPHSPISTIEDLVAVVRQHRADSFVALGGGSAVVTSRGKHSGA